jgi:hypothetical protein
VNLQLWPAHTEDTVVYESMGRRSWRWVLSFERWHVSIDKQLRDANDPASRWHSIDTWLGIGLRKDFRWGNDHAYYNSPHCTLNLGYVFIFRDGGLLTRRCAKCEGDED